MANPKSGMNRLGIAFGFFAVAIWLFVDFIEGDFSKRINTLNILITLSVFALVYLSFACLHWIFFSTKYNAFKKVTFTTISLWTIGIAIYLCFLGRTLPELRHDHDHARKVYSTMESNIKKLNYELRTRNANSHQNSIIAHEYKVDNSSNREFLNDDHIAEAIASEINSRKEHEGDLSHIASMDDHHINHKITKFYEIMTYANARANKYTNAIDHFLDVCILAVVINVTLVFIYFATSWISSGFNGKQIENTQKYSTSLHNETHKEITGNNNKIKPSDEFNPLTPHFPDAKASIVKDVNSANVKHVSNKSLTYASEPWSRIWAYWLDYQLLGFLGQIVANMVLGNFYFFGEPGKRSQILHNFIYGFICAWTIIPVATGLMQHLWGSTPGKFIFGIRVLDSNFNKPSLGTSIKRNYKILFNALCFAIPVIYIIGVFSFAGNLKKGIRPPWDSEKSTALQRCVHTKRTWIMWLLALLAMPTLYFLYFCAALLNEYFKTI